MVIWRMLFCVILVVLLSCKSHILLFEKYVLVNGINPYCLNVFSSVLQVKYQDNDVIVREGAEANTFYIILKGEVCVVMLCACTFIYKCFSRFVFGIHMFDYLPLPPLCVSPSGPGD